MEEFEKRSETETYGEEATTGAAEETTPEDARDEAGRYSGADAKQTSETEERRIDE